LYIILAILTLSLLFFYGCKDSLGIDPNVEIIPVQKNTKDADTTDADVDDSTENQKKVNNIIWNFQEIVLRKYPLKDTAIDWEAKVLKNDVRIDTTERIPKIWINAEMETNVPNSYFTWRHDRVTKFNLIFKACLNNYLYLLNGDEKIGRELSIFVQDMKNGMRFNYRGFQIFAKIIFNEVNRQKRIISGQVIVDFERIRNQETRAFIANFIINY
jgi:hypothetical protein